MRADMELPGRELSQSEFTRRAAWLDEVDQISVLHRVGRGVLHDEVDSEEAWAHFKSHEGVPRKDPEPNWPSFATKATKTVFPLYRAISAFEPKGHPPFWPQYVCTMFRRHCMKRRAPPKKMKPRGPGPHPLPILDDDTLQDWLGTLSPLEGEVMAMAFIDQWGNKKIATELHIAPNYVGVLKWRALQKLRACLEEATK